MEALHFLEEDGVMPDNASSNNRPKRYPAELKERAVRMVFETIEQTGERQGAVARVAHSLGIGVESLRNWVRQAEIDRGARADLTTEERRRISRTRTREP
jgi:transposase